MAAIIFAVIAALAIVALGLVTRRLLIERRVTTHWFDSWVDQGVKLDKLKTSMTNRARYDRKKYTDLYEELTASRQFARQLETFSSKRVAEKDRQLEQTYVLLEMVLEEPEHEELRNSAPLDREKIRRTFASG